MKRRLISDMDLPEFEYRCLHGFWTANPCDQPASYMAPRLRALGKRRETSWSEWRACEKHRLKEDVPMKRPTVLTSTVGQLASRSAAMRSCPGESTTD